MKNAFRATVKVCELAARVFPETPPRSASQRLRRWIAADGMLARRLARAGYTKGQRLMTRRQAMVVERWIGAG